jgi:hypothetical protein
MTLAALRRTLDENGLVERNEFEEALRRVAAHEATSPRQK